MSINIEITDFVSPWRLISGTNNDGSSITCLNYIQEVSSQNIVPYSLMMETEAVSKT
jgi:hypothetical protein